MAVKVRKCGHCGGELARCHAIIIGESCGQCEEPLCSACTLIVRLEQFARMKVTVTLPEVDLDGERREQGGRR